MKPFQLLSILGALLLGGAVLWLLPAGGRAEDCLPGCGQGERGEGRVEAEGRGVRGEGSGEDLAVGALFKRRLLCPRPEPGPGPAPPKDLGPPEIKETPKQEEPPALPGPSTTPLGVVASLLAGGLLGFVLYFGNE